MQHYAGCRQVRLAANKWLGMEFRISHPLQHWLFAAPTCAEVEEIPNWWARVALLQYAVQRVTNGARHGCGPFATEEEVQRALRPGRLGGARGHDIAKALLRPLMRMSCSVYCTNPFLHGSFGKVGC